MSSNLNETRITEEQRTKNLEKKVEPTILKEKHVVVNEQPQINEKHIYEEQHRIVEVPVIDRTIVHEKPSIINKTIIHEKPIIHEQPVIQFQEKVIREAPIITNETTKVLHEDAKVVREKPIIIDVISHTVTTTTTQTTTPSPATLQIINSNEFPADDVAIKNIDTYSSASHQEKPGFLQSVKMLFTGADKEIIHHEKDNTTTTTTSTTSKHTTSA